MDFEKAFDDFCNTNSGQTNYIKDLNEMFSTINNKQLEIIHQLRFYANKWELDELKAFCDTYLADLKNKGIKQGLFGTNIKQALRSYSLDELWGRINSSNINKVE